MSIIRQQILFDMHELYEMEPTHHFEAVFSTLNLNPIWALLGKPNNMGAPRQLNYEAMVYSLIARVVERIPTVKDLIRRLKRDPFFQYDCGFLQSDQVPSEASYSRMISVISESDAMDDVNDKVILLAISEEHIGEENAAFDASHFEARDSAQSSEKKESQSRKSAAANRKPNATSG